MMPRFPVSETKLQDLEARMLRLNLSEADLLEQFVRGSGAGGQKINKTSMAVLLRHLPTGIEVRCQESRSQALNRFLARRLLVEKMEHKIFQEASLAQQKIEKIRRQKRKRSRRAKEKVLQDKKHQAQKKSLRGKPDRE